ncbi:hypothetical protein [Geodermatophilus sp. FMUSA9-8]|uniref:hypothetical protein n=1 Tax=Geodermatophilus sp. FMUSA9-8 TaxID=3120155 RepID=UPI003009387B
MAQSKKLSRAEVRARRDERQSQFTASRVYGLTVEDPMAQTWESQAIVFATSPDEARALFQAIGFLKRNSQPIEANKLADKEFTVAKAQPLQVFLRRGHDFGWSRWYPLPAGYVHPPRGSVRGLGANWLLPGEPPDPADEFSSPRWRPSPRRPGLEA